MGAPAKNIATIGIDLAKNVFQLHGVNGHGKVVLRRQIHRGQMRGLFVNLPPCLIGMEACASAHYWARTLQSYGHTVRLIAPHFVKPYVKTHKTDATDLRPCTVIEIGQSGRFHRPHQRERGPAADEVGGFEEFQSTASAAAASSLRVTDQPTGAPGLPVRSRGTTSFRHLFYHPPDVPFAHIGCSR
jgi:hypothetical protein